MPTPEPPFVQLGYDEICEKDIDRLHGYAGICSANAPIGLPCDLDPIELDTELATQILIFSVTALEWYLAKEEPTLVQMLMEIGSMDAFLAMRRDALSAVEYLLGGTLACISYCREQKHALVVTW